MTLRQDGNNVSGVVRIAGRQDLPITGNVRGNEFHFEPADQSHRLRGHFLVTAGGMVGDALAGNNYPYRVLLQRRQPN
jgi:hypothetical protein